MVDGDGGCAKSVFAATLGDLMPPGSVTLVYDCFGNGVYRSTSGYRHRHKDALVQIANELAATKLCAPLIPTPMSDRTDLMRASMHRPMQAAAAVRAEVPEAVLCLVIDAADNAESAAQEAHDGHSFAHDRCRPVHV